MGINIGDKVKKYNTPRDFVRGTVIDFEDHTYATVELTDGKREKFPITDLFS